MMKKGSLYSLPTFAKALLWIAFIALLMIVAVTIWYVGMGAQTDTMSMKCFQLLQSTAVFILPALVVACLFSDRPATYLYCATAPSWWSALMVAVLALVAVPMINLLAFLNQQLVLPDWLASVEQWMQAQEDAANTLTEQFLQVDSVGGLLLNLLIMAAIPALGEELSFRAVLPNLLAEKTSRTIAIWVSAIIFSFIHFQFYGFVPRMLLGVWFGYLLLWSGSLWLPVIAHFTNNATAVIVAYCLPQENMGQLEELGVGATLWVGILCSVVWFAGTYALRRSLTMSNASSRS